MKIQTIYTLSQRGLVRLLIVMSLLVKPFYRMCYVATLANQGILKHLSGGALTLEQLARTLSIDLLQYNAFEAWLQMGVRLGELKLTEKGYSISGFLSKKLARSENDSFAAIAEEVAVLHHKLILETPAKLKAGNQWTLDDQDGHLIARSSRILEPFIYEAIDRVLPKNKPANLLEIGCGSGVYIRHAAEQNPLLTATGLELQPEVARFAESNIKEWGLADRVKIKTGDIRDIQPDMSYDLITLHNNIYYFPVEERDALLTHISCFIKPGGSLLLTTGCQGGSLIVEALNLWSASTIGCGRLPAASEMVAHLKKTGYRSVSKKNLIPGDAYFAFVGCRA